MKYLILSVIAISTVIFAYSKIPAYKTGNENNNRTVSESVRNSIIHVRGSIKDSDGNPIKGISILLNAEESGVKSGKDGTFEIDVPSDATLSFTTNYNREKRVMKIETVRENIDITITFCIDEFSRNKRISSIEIVSKGLGGESHLSTHFGSLAQSMKEANKAKKLDDKGKYTFRGNRSGSIKAENGKEFDGSISYNYESTADTKSIFNGTIKDKDGLPMSGIAVSIDGLDAKGTTDKEGNFMFEIPYRDSYILKFGEYDIKISVKRPSRNPIIVDCV
ncbi:MAG: carboxypeptidase-like regulatory domain-containing protein [Prevotella sp.]|nr:carboxypeptidase-like regulatory domain-containing protein [Prevotella sp.]